jgi:predicted glutamine amidotransferase
MCIIAIKPEGVSIPIERLKNCWDNNPDGAGLMYSENNELKIIKGLMDFDSFIKAYNDISPLEKKIIIHFRYATHGKVCKDLTHPFDIDKDLAFVHNGVLSINLDDPLELENRIDPKDITPYIKNIEEVDYIDNIDKIDEFIDDIEIDNISDSLEFCNILKKLPKDFLLNNAMLFLLNKYVEMEGSVIIFMDNMSNVNIVGINSHIIKDYVWYSNYDYRTTIKTNIEMEKNEDI